MSYNLVENSNLYYNTASGTGNVTLTILETVAIANLTSTKYISGDVGNILCLDTDLGARIKIGEIRYYFSSVSASGTVASGINFYYKNENFESYSPLAINIGNGYYYTTVSGVSAPRYVRMIHTVSGTSVSGTVVGFNILNDDAVVDFGTDGTTESFITSVSVLGAPEIITTIPVYNDGIRVSTAYVTLEPQGTNVDELLTISASEDGPWVGVIENAELLANEDTWINGNYDDTELTVDNKLTLISGAPAKDTGTYTTKIFDNNSKNSFIDIDIESELDGSMVTADDNKQVKTIELRSTNQAPKRYNICRCFFSHLSGGYYYLYHTDYYEDGTVLYTSGDFSGSKSDGSTVYVRNAVIDSNNEKTYGAMFKSKEVNDWKQLAVFTISRTGTYNQKVIYYSNNNSNFTFYTYYLCPDTDGGFWAQLYSAGAYGQGGYAIDQGVGHYLIHFYSDFTYSYRYYTGSSRYYTYMDCVYATGKLWVVDGTNSMVKLITPGGTTEVNFSDSASLRDICATSNGGCWYISGTNLINLDSEGTYVKTLESVGTTSIRRIKLDGDDAFYIRDGEYVKRIFIDGTLDFSVYVANADRLTQVTEDGVWVRTSDNKHRFVDKSEKALTAANISYSYYPAAMGYSYDDDGHGDHFPINIDTHWNDLEWQEVRPDKYPLPIGDTYHQARITLQSNGLAGGDWDSPIVNGIYNQKSIEIPNIYPTSYRNIYLKASVPNQSLDWVGEYNSALRTWWEIPTNV